MAQVVVKFAPKKVEQLIQAAHKQLSQQEYARFVDLIRRIQVGVILTSEINAELGDLMSRISWTLEIEVSPEWAEALIECDKTYLGYELRDMFLDFGMMGPRVHKKELCRRLYMLGHPSVVAVMEPYLNKGKS